MYIHIYIYIYIYIYTRVCRMSDTVLFRPGHNYKARASQANIGSSQRGV